MDTPTQEKLWVLRAQCRDRDALEALLRSVQPSLRRYLAGVVGTTDADDLLQDVLFIIVRKIENLEDPVVFRPWAFRIASRQAFRHLKKRRVWQQRHEDDSALEAMAGPELPIECESVRQLLPTNPYRLPAVRSCCCTSNWNSRCQRCQRSWKYLWAPRSRGWRTGSGQFDGI